MYFNGIQCSSPNVAAVDTIIFTEFINPAAPPPHGKVFRSLNRDLADLRLTTYQPKIWLFPKQVTLLATQLINISLGAGEYNRVVNCVNLLFLAFITI